MDLLFPSICPSVCPSRVSLFRPCPRFVRGLDLSVPTTFWAIRPLRPAPVLGFVRGLELSVPPLLGSCGHVSVRVLEFVRGLDLSVPTQFWAVCTLHPASVSVLDLSVVWSCPSPLYWEVLVNKM